MTTEREQALVELVVGRLRVHGLELREDGWRPELIVFAPEELPRLKAGYKVGLIVPVEEGRADAST